jgi:intraflagellar transport protein 122
MVRSKPFSDSQLHEPFCNRCMNQNPIISKSDKCASCNHPIVSSFLSFNALPVVEFKVPPNISLSKVLEFVNRDKSNIQTKKP